MAKFRTNHSGDSSKQSSGMIARVGLFGAIIAGLFFVFNQFTGGGSTADVDNNNDSAPHQAETHLPNSTTGDVIYHNYYVLSYSEEHEQAEWVAYELTKEELEMPWLARDDNFRSDPKVTTGSATNADYKHSGYDRGHLLPVADRAFSEAAMTETFFMSNISPQSRNFNGGIWRELEEQTRYWAKRNGALHVVTGPVLTLPPKGRIGDNEVSVPAAYFKVLLDTTEPQVKGIGFILPNEVSYDPLFDYAVSIDEVEQRTGLDFFGGLLSGDEEAEVEAQANIDLWPFSKQKYDERINKWNKR